MILTTSPSQALTPRQLEVTALITAGFSNKEIARALCVSPHTVRGHVANIMGRLDAPNRTAVAVLLLSERAP